MFMVPIALLLGFVLIIVESYIVMDIKNENTIYLGGMKPFITIWAMNFFFVYTIISQVKQWYVTKVSNNQGFGN